MQRKYSHTIRKNWQINQKYFATYEWRKVSQTNQAW